MIKTPSFDCKGTQVQSLVRELRSHRLCGVANMIKMKNNSNKNTTEKTYQNQRWGEKVSTVYSGPSKPRNIFT